MTAQGAMVRRVPLVVGCVLVALLVFVGSAHAEYGLSKFDVTFTEQNGSPDFQAGSHPFAMTTTIRFDSVPNGLGGEELEQTVKDIIVSEAKGFVGDAPTIPRCASEQFVIERELDHSACPNSTVIGINSAVLSSEIGAGPVYSPVYNLVPPPHVAAKIGFWVGPVPVPIEIGVNESAPYEVVGGPTNISQVLEVLGDELTLWGSPADPAHDPVRGECLIPIGKSNGLCPAGVAERPFLTLPRACEGPLESSYAIDTWQHPASFLPDGLPNLSNANWLTGSVLTHNTAEPSEPQGFTGCNRLAFNPTITATPTTRSASSPTGLDFTLNVNDEGLTSPTGVADSDMKKAVVTLPEQVSVNPALAEGLAACSEADLAKETISASPGEGCPNESKIGTVEVETPLLEQVLKGSLYLATPYQNPFGSLLGLYVVIKNPETGVLLKLPGKVTPNETTGQLVSEFDNLPQLPFSHFRLHFREGQRSPLATPDACGTYTTTADLMPYANPSQVLHDTASFQIESGIAGGPCPTGGVPPFKPGLIAGTLNNQADAYTTTYVEITRNDSEQEITGFSTLLPPGVTGNLTGVPFCSQADIAAAIARSTKQGGGAEEEANPSCPVASEIGHTQVGVGVGTVLAYNPGKLYLAGPYEGAPFSVVSITAAKVGPFDLGTVIVHLPLDIDPLTAQVSIPQGAADQIPHIVKGIVVHVRDIRVYVDRPDFTLNPTNCEPLSLSATVYGAGANPASPANIPSTTTDRFQAANCANLAFKPTFTASTSSTVSKTNGTSLHVNLAYPQNSLGKEANIHQVKVELPKQLPSRLTTLQKACTAAQFHTNPAGCPAASVVGHAKAITPILPVPLEGPAYFVSNGGEAFPNLIMVLQGYGVTIDLVGDTYISKTGITSSTFKTVPDQPVQSFELTLPQGPYSALTANTNLCAQPLLMPTEFVAQNGATLNQETHVEVEGCSDTLAIVKHKVHKQTVTVSVYMPTAGKLKLTGHGLHTNTKTAKNRETITLNITQKHPGKLHTRLRVVFTPTTGKTRKRQVKTLKIAFTR